MNPRPLQAVGAIAIISLLGQIQLWAAGTSKPIPESPKLWVENKGDAGPYLVSNVSCEDLYTHVRAMHKWKESVDGAGKVPTDFDLKKSCKKEKENKRVSWKIPIGNFLPASVVNIYGKRPGCDGMNCFNTALIANGFSKVPRFTTGASLALLFGSEHCQIRNGPPQPGDFAVSGLNEEQLADLQHVQRELKSNDPSFDHASIYVDDRLSFEKQSAGADNVPKLVVHEKDRDKKRLLFVSCARASSKTNYADLQSQ